MPTIDDVFRRMATIMPSDAHEPILVDPVKRLLIVPESERIFGVETDRQSERKYFCFPSIVGDSLQLANSAITIEYINAEGGLGSYDVDEIAVTGDQAMFSWLLDEDVTRYPGSIKFAVHVEYGSKEWNTTYAAGEVLAGYC